MGRIKKILLNLCIGVVVLGVFIGAKTQEKIKIGAVLPLTGKSAQYGTWIQEALELGREEINAKGGINGKLLQIIYEDSQADPKLAVTAMEKLCTVDKVPIVYGCWASSCVLAQAPIAERTHTILIGEAISPKIRDAGDYVFRMQPDARYYIHKLVPYIYKKMRIRNVSISYINNDFGVDQADVFEKEFTKLGGNVLSKDAFAQGATDFKTDLIKIKAKNPQAIFVPGYTELAIILKQAKELGMTQQFFTSVPFENPAIVEAAGGAAEGVIYPHHFDPENKYILTKSYQEAYKKKYGRYSEGFAALAYDGMRIIAYVLKKCGENPEAIKNNLYNIKNYPGVTGPTTFDDKGDVIKPIVIKTVKNGRFVKIKEVK
ncbi:MAG: ABC transporter substrate-binding protein [Candidatus Desantisbacteria bacterium]